jgi:putative FmdB family regulatory protein
MPTYVYKCADNGHVFELVQKFSADPGAECSNCGSESKRQITAPTVIYKGSGFYTTDYGSGSSGANSKPSNGISSDSSKSSDSESDSSSSSKSSAESKKSDSGKDSGSSHSHGAESHTH